MFIQRVNCGAFDVERTPLARDRSIKIITFRETSLPIVVHNATISDYGGRLNMTVMRYCCI
jgi:hypothetical protein